MNPDIKGPKTGPMNGESEYIAIGLGSCQCQNGIEKWHENSRADLGVDEEITDASARNTEERSAAEAGQESENQENSCQPR